MEKDGLRVGLSGAQEEEGSGWEQDGEQGGEQGGKEGGAGAQD